MCTVQWHIQRGYKSHPTLVNEQLVYSNKAVTACNRLNCETIKLMWNMCIILLVDSTTTITASFIHNLFPILVFIRYSKKCIPFFPNAGSTPVVYIKKFICGDLNHYNKKVFQYCLYYCNSFFLVSIGIVYLESPYTKIIRNNRLQICKQLQNCSVFGPRSGFV